MTEFNRHTEKVHAHHPDEAQKAHVEAANKFSSEAFSNVESKMSRSQLSTPESFKNAAHDVLPHLNIDGMKDGNNKNLSNETPNNPATGKPNEVVLPQIKMM